MVLFSINLAIKTKTKTKNPLQILSELVKILHGMLLENLDKASNNGHCMKPYPQVT